MCLVHWLTDPLHILIQCWQQWPIIAGHASTGITILHSNSRHAAFQSGKSNTVVWPSQMADNCVVPWRNAHLAVLPRCHWPLDERKWSWGNLRCCIQWYQHHVKWEDVAKGNARFPHGDHSFTAAVHIGWYHRGSKHWRRTGNGTQHTNRSAVGWLFRYPHLLSPPVPSCRAGRWLAPAHVLSERHAAILFRKFPLEFWHQNGGSVKGRPAW